jgi:hypothetical protein
MRNSSQHLWNGAAKRCAICDGKFGLIRHYCCQVHRSALTASCVARKMTVDGYVGLKQPDNGQAGRPAGILGRLALPSEEVVQ